jgi:hypothetical protein
MKTQLNKPVDNFGINTHLSTAAGGLADLSQIAVFAQALFCTGKISLKPMILQRKYSFPQKNRSLITTTNLNN